MPLPPYEKIEVSTTLTHSPTARTNSNKRKTTFSNHKRKKKQDKLLANVACDHGDDGVPAGQHFGSCKIISENTKTITLRILYHLKLAASHLLMPESGKADLLPSTPLTGTATDSPWVTTFSTRHFPHTTRKKQN